MRLTPRQLQTWWHRKWTSPAIILGVAKCPDEQHLEKLAVVNTVRAKEKKQGHEVVAEFTSLEVPSRAPQ